jgi:hypothetical protein
MEEQTLVVDAPPRPTLEELQVLMQTKEREAEALTATLGLFR